MRIVSEKKTLKPKQWDVMSPEVLRHKDLSDGAKTLWCLLYNWDSKTETDYPQLANIFGLKKRSIMRNMAELRLHGYAVKSGDRKDTIYSVKFVAKDGDRNDTTINNKRNNSKRNN